MAGRKLGLPCEAVGNALCEYPLIGLIINVPSAYFMQERRLPSYIESGLPTNGTSFFGSSIFHAFAFVLHTGAAHRKF
jgi:hypothetical protein